MISYNYLKFWNVESYELFLCGVNQYPKKLLCSSQIHAVHEDVHKFISQVTSKITSWLSFLGEKSLLRLMSWCHLNPANSMNTQKLNPGLEIVLIMEVKCYVITLYSLNQTNLSTSYDDISISKLTNLATLTAGSK